jgi:hypothetical protein
MVDNTSANISQRAKYILSQNNVDAENSQRETKLSVCDRASVSVCKRSIASLGKKSCAVCVICQDEIIDKEIGQLECGHL